MTITERLNIPVPLTRDDITVLSWYAAWTPEMHRASWNSSRRWEPGFRYMADCSGWGKLEEAEKLHSDPPALRGEEGSQRSAARGLLGKLLSYRLLEGHSCMACRLTPRGRAALKSHCRDAPDAFMSHCPDIFEDYNLLPTIDGVFFRQDFMDKAMGRLGEEYQGRLGTLLPDNKKTWDLMLAEYNEGDHAGRHTLTGARATLSTASANDKNLNGSLRNHSMFVRLSVSAPDHGEVLAMSMSLEGLADLLVSNMGVPVTLDRFNGRDGNVYQQPAPPPVSVTRRMQERIARGNQDIQNRIRTAMEQVREAKMGKKAQAAILFDLELALRDADSHGSHAVTMATEEISSVAESMMTIMTDQAESTGGFLGNIDPSIRGLIEGK